MRVKTGSSVPRRHGKSSNDAGLDAIANVYLCKDVSTQVDHRIKAMVTEKIVSRMSGQTILKMGYGGGESTKVLLSRFDTVHVVEGAEQLVKEGVRRFGERVKFYHSLFEDFRCTNRFDIVLADNVLEHVEKPVAVMENMTKCLKSDGLFHVIVPNRSSLHRLYGVCLGLLGNASHLSESDIRLGHQRVYSLNTLKVDIRKAGLAVCEVLPTFVKLLSNAQMNDYSDAQLQGLIDLADHIPAQYHGAIHVTCCRDR